MIESPNGRDTNEEPTSELVPDQPSKSQKQKLDELEIERKKGVFYVIIGMYCPCTSSDLGIDNFLKPNSIRLDFIIIMTNSLSN
jgi:hypothetical protein